MQSDGRVRRWAWAALCAAALSGCVTAPGDPPEAGNFTGSLLVLWVGEGSGESRRRPGFSLCPIPTALSSSDALADERREPRSRRA